MNKTILTALLTVAAGSAAFLAADILRPETRNVTFETEPRDVGPLEAINGAAFPRAKGVVTITEPLAHLRLPLKRMLLGKQVVIHPRFHLDEGDVLEVGVKKTSFWLDYHRLPLQHRLLDVLLVRDDNTWSALRSGSRIVYLNPRFENPWQTLEEFEERPPTDGTIGLYGNAVLPMPDTRPVPRSPARPAKPWRSREGGVGGPRPETRPFRVTDDPDSLRAIYAFYPELSRRDPEWTENAQRFDLARAYQNEDGSIEIMFFVQRKEEGAVRVLMDAVEFRIEPGWPRPRDLVAQARQSIVRLLRRPAVRTAL